MKIFPLFIAIRYLFSKNKDGFANLISTLASFGMVLGIMAMVIVLSIMNGLENMQKQNLLSNMPHAILLKREDYFNKNLMQENITLPSYIEKTMPINQSNIIIQNKNGNINIGQIIGIDELNEESLTFLNIVVKGVFLKKEELKNILEKGRFQILINEIFAKKENIGIGDKLRIMISENYQFSPFGKIPTQRLFTVSGFYQSLSNDDQQVFFANLTDVGKLLKLSEDKIQGIRLFLKDPFLVNKLEKTFEKSDFKIKDWREQKGEFFQAIKMEKNLMMLLIGLIVLVSISNIITSLSIMLMDKQNEIAILKTMGATSFEIMQIFILKGMVIALCGNFIGLILGFLITLYLNEILSLFNVVHFLIPVKIDLEQIALIISFFILISFISVLYPAFKASQEKPTIALI